MIKKIVFAFAVIFSLELVASKTLGNQINPDNHDEKTLDNSTNPSYKDEICFQGLDDLSMCCKKFESLNINSSWITDIPVAVEKRVQELQVSLDKDILHTFDITQIQSRVYQSMKTTLASNTALMNSRKMNQVLHQLGAVFTNLYRDNYRIHARVETIYNDLETILLFNNCKVLSKREKVAVLRYEMEKAEQDVKLFEERLKTVQEVIKKLEDSKDKARQNLCLPPYAWQGGGCYYLSWEKKTWYNAQRHCYRIGGDLAFPPDFRLLTEWLFYKNLTDDVWIGFSDSDTEGEWQWINGTSVDISSKEPVEWNDPSKRENENCLEICVHYSSKPTDQNCEDENFFLCQWNARRGIKVGK